MVIALRPCEGVTPRCAICHDDDLDGVLLCAGCRTRVHAECRVGVACPTLGCPSRSRRGVARPFGCKQSVRHHVRGLARKRRSLSSRLVPWMVLGVCGLLLAAVMTVDVKTPGYTSLRERVRADMRSIGNALDLYKIETGHYPDQLKNLWEPPIGVSRWNGPYLTDGPPRDSWGNEYAYFFFGMNHYVILSFGADGQPGGVDADADLSSRAIDAAE